MTLDRLLLDAMRRLDEKRLLGMGGSVSVRLPGTRDMLLATPDIEPVRVPLSAQPSQEYAQHIGVYAARPDVGAIASGGGTFGRMLGSFGGDLPQLFDEQARHLGATVVPMRHAMDGPLKSSSLATGGNVWASEKDVMVFGGTVHRLVLNAELLEKCAKAYVLAKATGMHLHTLPWWVCHIANGRLKKDQKRAARRFAQGVLPEEVKGY
ncbi:class II aldolase/adducin family protein [Dyella sp.]|uniref:class II aldolase/adducin family protein n=1 Tax=Dyella sp. TaxID=1869338 RepID=UPI002B45A01D|nr:class II aldolase/adducin family protein [Dyella sp.]HKT27225.1 class II aldolase/adducin family protein [Dyella sp.]